MSLKTYDQEINVFDASYRPWPFTLMNGAKPAGGFRPGEWVTHEKHGGFGMVIAHAERQMTILWSKPPFHEFSTIAFPTVRRVQPGLIANQLVSIQPMTMPTGLVFYMDYTYGGIDAKCKEGPWWRRIYWKAVRLWRTRIRSFGSSSASWLRSQFTKKLSSPANTAEQRVFGPNEEARKFLTPDVTKSIVDQWVNRNAAKAGRPRV